MPDTPAPPQRPVSRAIVVLLSVFAVVAVGLATWWPAAVTGSASRDVPAGGTCVGFDTPDADQLCVRQAEDRARRAPVADEQRTEAEARMSELDRVVLRVGLCLDAQGNPCGGGNPKRPATAADAGTAVQRLKEAGFGDGSTARVAREADPAPLGSLFYAAELPGGACVVGHITEVPRRSRRPSGRGEAAERALRGRLTTPSADPISRGRPSRPRRTP